MPQRRLRLPHTLQRQALGKMTGGKMAWGDRA